MTIPEAIALGVIQGLTEFLPVSSSGHLVLFQHLFGIQEPMLAFDIAVHWGTLLAVFVYFRRDFWGMISQTALYLIRVPGFRKNRPRPEEFPYAVLTGLVIFASVPTALIAILFKDRIETHFHSIALVGFSWIVTGILLLVTRKFSEGSRRLGEIRPGRALTLGVGQGIGIVPGISRSGITIALGMFCGIERKTAARFSFLMAAPAILGAGILKMKEGLELFQSYPVALGAGFASSVIVGYWAIVWLLKIVERGKFYLFGFYCSALGVFTLMYVFVKNYF